MPKPRVFTVRRPYEERCGGDYYYVVGGMSLCSATFVHLTGLRLKPGESARVRLVRVKGRGK